MTGLPETTSTDEGAGGGLGPVAGGPRRRRWLSRLVALLLALLVVAVLAGVLLRLYFTNERLRVLVRDYLIEHTGTAVDLGRLEVSLLDGIEIDGFRLAPLPGFRRPPLRFDRVAFHWSFWELFRLRLVIREIALEGMSVALEESSTGQNFELLRRRLFPAAEKPAASAPAPATPAPAAPATPAPVKDVSSRFVDELSLPLRVEVHRLVVSNLAAEVERPGLQAHIDHVNVEGWVAGRGRDLRADLWAGLGERPADGASAAIRFARRAPAADVDATVRLGLHVTSEGLGHVGLTVDLDSRTRVNRPYLLPVLAATGRLELALDLLNDVARLSTCHWQLGKRTTLDIRGAAEHLLSAAPRIQLEALALALDLDELGPLASALSPQTQTAGRLKLEVSPFSADLGGALPRATLTLVPNHVRLVSGDRRLEDLDGRLVVTGDGSELVRYNATLSLAQALAAGSEVRALELALSGTAPVAPFLGGAAKGAIAAQIQVQARRAGASSASLPGGFELKLDAAVPAALVLGRPHAAPLDFTVHLAAPAAELRAYGLERLAATISGKALDLDARRLQVGVRLRSAGVWLLQETERVELPPLDLALDLSRDADDYDIQRLAIGLGELASLALKGTILGATSATPRFRALHLASKLPHLDALLAVVPPGRRPPVELKGDLELEAEATGTLPLADLTRMSRPPQVGLGAGYSGWRQAVEAYADFVQGWASYFDVGIPFSASARLRLDCPHYRDATSEVAGLVTTADLDFAGHGPVLHLAVDAAELLEPTRAKGAHLEIEFRGSGSDAALQVSGKLAELAPPGLVSPLTDVSFALAGHYRLGGDTVLDFLRFDESGHGMHVEASGVVTKPLSLVLERGWEKAGLPGVDAAFRFVAGFGKPGPLAPLTSSGVAMGGVAELRGSLRARGGLVSLTGALKADGLSYESGPTAVEAVNGSLPYDVALYAGRRDDAAIIARTPTLGGGLLSLVVSGDDVRERPARPAYYDRLRAYRRHSGLTIKSLRHGAYEISDFSLDGRLESGMLVADWLSLHVLGGDVVGNAAFQLARDASVRCDVAVQFSGLDASNFKLLHLTPGPDSELDANLHLGLLLAPALRDLTVNMNVTKIGAETLDRFLQVLDPEGKDKELQDKRSKLGWIRIHELAVWIRYENLNMDLAGSTKLHIPFTQIGYPPIPHELLRRSSLSGFLDTYLQPYVNAYVAKPLGWTHAH